MRSVKAWLVLAALAAVSLVGETAADVRLKAGGKLQAMGDGSVRIMEEEGKRPRPLGDGVHTLTDGKFIIIVGGKIVGPDRIISPRDPALGAAAPAMKIQKGGGVQGILIGMRPVRLAADGSVKIIGEEGKQSALPNGLHALGDGRFIIIIGSKIAGPDRVIGPVELPFVETKAPAAKSPGR